MIVRSKLLATGVLGLLFLLGPSVVSANIASICDATPGNLVHNCGFEAGVYTSGANPGVPNDWTSSAAFDLNPGFNLVTDSNSLGPHSGSFDLSISNFDDQPLATLTQTITDVSGATYTVGFFGYDGGAGGDGNAFLSVSVGSAGATMNDTVAVWTPAGFTFTGTGSDTLTISAQTNPSEWYVDDVTVLGPSPTPEPASLLLMGTGLLGMAGVLRRRLFHA